MPLAIDLYCGLGGWTEGLLAEDWDVIGFDIERHEYGEHRYPAQLVLQDVLTLHGSQFRSADLIVASPPCQKYSYMAMPWSKSKALIAWYKELPERIAELNALFDACFRIQREACEAAGRHIPLVVENVRGAIPWVGRSRWNFGSFHLWGDVPALMPMVKLRGPRYDEVDRALPSSMADLNEQQDDSRFRGCAPSDIEQLGVEIDPDAGRKGYAARLGESTVSRRYGSKSSKRKAASALIAKIPLVLARHIARTYYPTDAAAGER